MRCICSPRHWSTTSKARCGPWVTDLTVSTLTPHLTPKGLVLMLIMYAQGLVTADY